MVDISRRNFFRARNVNTTPAIRLPWTADEQLFTQGCTQCGNCISACEENIIIKGDGGFPEINFELGECSFCQACVNSCEELLFTETNHKPWQVDISIKNNCLTKKQIHCQVCQDACEPQAIHFQYQQASVPQPNISQPDCTGCGACVAICPENAISLTISPIGATDE